MPDRYKLVKAEGSWGTEYRVQEIATSRLLRNPDGSIFKTTSGHHADAVCRQANER